MLTTAVSNFETRLFFCDEPKLPKQDGKVDEMRLKWPCQGCVSSPQFCLNTYFGLQKKWAGDRIRGHEYREALFAAEIGKLAKI